MDVLVAADDLDRVHVALQDGVELSDEQVRQVVSVMTPVPLESIALTRGWYPLAETLVTRSTVLRGHIFGLLEDPKMADPASAAVVSAR